MNRDIVLVFVSALVATANPSLLAATTVMMLLPQRRRLMTGYLLGAYTTSVVAGLVIVFSLHRAGVVKTSTHLLSPSGQLAIGAIALTVAVVMATGHDSRVRGWREHRNKAHASATGPWSTRMLGRGSAAVTFAVGAAMSFPGVSYVSALDHIAALNPPTISVLLLVVYFCVMQQVVLEGALLASTFAPARTEAVIVRLKGWFARHGRQVATVGLFAVGVLLTARGALTVS